MMPETLRFKPDSRLRDRFMVRESFQHPAKLHMR